MSDTNDARPRRFSEEEVERILRRATELETERPPTTADAGGLTLAELEQIGAEAGLRPELLRRAAREVEGGATSRPVRAAPFVGAPVVIRLEREIEGELDRRALESLIPELRRAAEGTGHPAVVGSTLSWESSDKNELRSLGVTVTSSGGRTRIWIEERLSRLAGSLFGGIVGGFGGGVGIGVGVGVGVGALGSALFATAFPVALLGGSYLVARGVFRMRYEDRREALAGLMERVAGDVERKRSLPGAGGTGGAAGGTPRGATPSGGPATDR